MKRIAIILISMLPALVCMGGIVPEPAGMTPGKGNLKISGAVFKCDPAIDSAAMDAISRFAARLSLVSGKTSSVSAPFGLKAAVEGGAVKGMVFLKDNVLEGESYHISIGQKAAIVRAGSREGFLNALQTLKQMLPEEIYGEEPAEKQKWMLPRCEIADSPANGIRGLSIDSCENFWSIDQIILCLDEMAKYKFNRLRWNLAGERGWRMEVRKYPLLGQAGGYRMENGVRYGGYYTTEELARVVSHAASLGISVTPVLHISQSIMTLLKPEDTPVQQFIGDIVSETAIVFPDRYEAVSCTEDLPIDEILKACGKEPAPAAGFPEVNPASPDIAQLRILAEKLW